ncbi:hypothetical protein MAPG_10457 [Magnaporthiopsis poae ATCC 64411]|uniref:F-box domain-containing protein n=1 Tax=Magnaporthiopsis poae (strain ATCC 64411 / 73-15) TaxID=644358 RepID=A0A0C4ECM6_MAGP6|nr:hypothetical protein MAPG_10457 [Magnaporthiopsis poae ATCC 64411]
MRNLNILPTEDLPFFDWVSLPIDEDQAPLRCIADHIHNKPQLRKLCRVSKAFHSAFTPALYREMDIVTSRRGNRRDIFEALPKNPHLRHVRRLQLDLNHGDNRGPVNSIVRSLVRRMPMLEEFEWDGGILLQETQMTILLSCPRLESFVMLYESAEMPSRLTRTERSSRNRRRRDHATYTGNRFDCCYSSDDKGHVDVVQSALATADMHHLVPFSSLTKLKIGDMYGLDSPLVGDLDSRLKDDWKADILRILLASPDLQELSLAFGDGCVKSLDDRFATRLAPFLQSLCEEYHTQGGKPLKLRALGLGLGVLLKSASDLSKLVDLEHLQEVYIDNRGKMDGSGRCEPDGGWGINTQIAWHTFSQDDTPNLRQVKLASDVVNFERLGGYLASLIASPIRTQIQNREIRKKSGLSQVILKLWDSRQEPAGHIEPTGHGAHTDDGAHFDDGVDGLFTVLVPQGNATSADGLDPTWQAFFGLAASSSRLVVYTRFSSGRDVIMNLAKLEAGLRTLPHVRDLVVACPLVWPGLVSLHMPKIRYLSGESVFDECYHQAITDPRWRGAVASRLARAGRGLRTVKFGFMAWRVLRGGGADGSEVTRLVSMDKYEQRLHGCDRGPANAFPEFAMGEPETSYEGRFCCDFVVRMW